MKKTFAITAIALAASATATGSFAQNYPAPNKNITFVVPFAAGGPTDRVARDLAEAMRKPLNATIVIENLGGAGSSIGTAKVANANPDGYTLLVNHIGMSTMPTLYRKLSFDVLKDFEFLGIVNDVPMTVIGRPNLPANNFAELRELINKDKENINLGHSGLGSAGHLCGLMFQSALNVPMTPVPYKGAAPAITDLMGGTIDLMCDQTTNTTPQIEGGKVKAFAVTSPKRLSTPALKDLPTLDEAGLKGFQVAIWHALYAPKGTPKPILEKLNAALKAALKDPEFVKREEALGAVIVSDDRVNPEGHKKFVESEINKWGPIIRAAGTYAD